MLESTFAGLFGFSNAVAEGTAGDVQHRAGELLGDLDVLAQAGGEEDAFKRALLEKAGFLVALAQAGGDEGCWLDAFKKGIRDAAEMLKPVPTVAQAASPVVLDA